MPAILHYKGELCFSSYSELETASDLLKEKIPETGLQLNADRDQLKLAVTFEQPFSKKNALQKVLDKAAAFATTGMLLEYHDNNFQDVICANRNNGFDPKRPAVLMFTLTEFEQTFGKLEMEISDVVYNSPFYIYDISLKRKGPKFADELPISDHDCTVGFAIADKAWLDHVSQSETFLYSSLFKQLDETADEYDIQSTVGFAPGYSMEGAIAEAKKGSFLVYRWNEYWNE